MSNNGKSRSRNARRDLMKGNAKGRQAERKAQAHGQQRPAQGKSYDQHAYDGSERQNEGA